jgi:hypothetical protein
MQHPFHPRHRYHRHRQVAWLLWPQALLRELCRVRLLDKHPLLRVRKSASKLPPTQLQRREPLPQAGQREQRLVRMMQQLLLLRLPRHAQLLE